MVARLDERAAVFESHDLIADAVQEIAVVADHEHGANEVERRHQRPQQQDQYDQDTEHRDDPDPLHVGGEDRLHVGELGGGATEVGVGARAEPRRLAREDVLCSADRRKARVGVAPITSVGTIIPGDNDLTGTPLVTEAIGTAETSTAIATATGLDLEAPTLRATGAATQAVGTVATGTTQTPVVPVTGQEIMLVECQFCVDTRAYALLVLPDTATLSIISPAPSATTGNITAADAEPRCTTVEVNNGRQVVLCSGPEMTPLVVNICTDDSTCTDFPVDLLACPLAQGGQVNPVPAQTTPDITGDTATATPLATSTPGIGISTPTP